MNKMCPNCGGHGWTAEHVRGDHYDCDQLGCPVQVPCEKCEGTGQVKELGVKDD